MTDIITRAQELAANGHPPRPWKVDYGPYLGADVDILDRDGELICGIEGYTDVDGGEIADRELGEMLAFAPDAVAALAEETWVYGVEIFIGGRWIMVKNKALATSTIEAAAWFPDRRSAEALQGVVEIPSETRIVRRRVSPVEVVE